MSLQDDAKAVLKATAGDTCNGQEGCAPGCGSGMGSCHANVSAAARRLALARLGLTRCQHPSKTGMRFTEGWRREECDSCHETTLVDAKGVPV